MVWFTSLSVFLRIYKAASLVSRIHFCLFCNSLRHGSPGRNDFRLSMRPFFSLSLWFSSSNPREDALISLRSSWNTGCRPNKVWRDRWEKFLRLKSGGFSPVYLSSLLLSPPLPIARFTAFSKKIWENGGIVKQVFVEHVILSFSLSLGGKIRGGIYLNASNFEGSIIKFRRRYSEYFGRDSKI